MRKNFIVLVVVVLSQSLFVFASPNPYKVSPSVAAELAQKEVPGDENLKMNAGQKKTSLYETLNLAQLGLSKEAFDYAFKGYNAMIGLDKLNNRNILSIVDFSLPSSKKRLFIVDIKNEKLLFNTYVAHGKGSGMEMAREFSNVPESNKSSLGFYVTGDTYMGKHGFSLRLLGQENGINDNANSRAIVMHSADYVTEDVIKLQGYIGRSLGCPALPEAMNKPIIDKIKNGSCLFLYSPDKSYLTNSSILKKASIQDMYIYLLSKSGI